MASPQGNLWFKLKLKVPFASSPTVPSEDLAMIHLAFAEYRANMKDVRSIASDDSERITNPEYRQAFCLTVAKLSEDLKLYGRHNNSIFEIVYSVGPRLWNVYFSALTEEGKLSHLISLQEEVQRRVESILEWAQEQEERDLNGTEARRLDLK